MAQSRYYSATAQPTVLTAGITPTSTIIQVQQTVGFPVSVPYILALDYNTSSEEVVLVTAQAGLSLTVTRGYDSTSATSHNAGAAVRHTWTAMDGNDSRAHEAATANVHGVTGNLVGETQTQTLTNKTLSSPVITGTVTGGASYTAPTLTSPVITGTVTGGATYSSPVIRDASVINSAVGVIPATINAIASTTADLLKIQLNASDKLRIEASGRINATPTNAATDGVFLNAASGFAGSLQKFQVNAVNKWVVDQNGSLTTALNATLTGTLSAGAAGFTVDGTGNVTAAANITVGSWVSYSPSWTTGGTQPVLGNGTLTGRYSIQGKTITTQISLTFGSTTTSGTGQWSFGLPFTSANTIATNCVFTGGCMGFDNGVAFYPGTAMASPNSSSVLALCGTNAGGNTGSGFGATNPFTWGNTDTLSITITYESV